MIQLMIVIMEIMKMSISNIEIFFPHIVLIRFQHLLSLLYAAISPIRMYDTYLRIEYKIL